MIVIYKMETKKLYPQFFNGRDNFFSLVGLFLILFHFHCRSIEHNIPSLQSLIPLIGVTMILIFSKKNTLVSQIISYRIFTFIEKISYSIYLYHLVSGIY